MRQRFLCCVVSVSVALGRDVFPVSFLSASAHKHRTDSIRLLGLKGGCVTDRQLQHSILLLSLTYKNV